MNRQSSIMIRPAARRGYSVHIDGVDVAGLTSRQEAAQFIEDVLGELPGEIEHKQTAVAEMADLPNVIRPRTGKWNGIKKAVLGGE